MGQSKTQEEIIAKCSLTRLITRINISEEFFSAEQAHYAIVRRSHYKGDLKIDGKKIKDAEFHFCNLLDYVSREQKKEAPIKEIEYSYTETKTLRTGKVILGQNDIDLLSIEVNKTLKKIDEDKDIRKELGSDDLRDLTGDEPKSGFRLVALPGYQKFRPRLDHKEKEKPVYRIRSSCGKYYVMTGPFCGEISFGKNISLEIVTGYSDKLFRRMLCFLCGIYAETEDSKTKPKNLRSFYSLITQYLYIVSLRKLMGKAIPRKYLYPRERGYGIRGSLDVSEYIRNDLVRFDKKLTSVYPERTEVTNIIDVLYAALKACKLADRDKLLPGLASFEVFLRENSSGRTPTRRLIDGILGERCLKNALFAEYKTPLSFAQMILRHEDSDREESSGKSGVSGRLVDSSFLWEMYLYHLMKNGLPDWDVDAQVILKFYGGRNKDDKRFYAHTNRPDYVLRNRIDNRVFILDAKFKQMTFEKDDVDVSDVHEVHSYSYYYQLTEKNRFGGTALLYPTKTARPEGESYSFSPIFGISSAEPRFDILTLKDDPDNLIASEANFISDLKKFIAE